MLGSGSVLQPAATAPAGLQVCILIRMSFHAPYTPYMGKLWCAVLPCALELVHSSSHTKHCGFVLLRESAWCSISWGPVVRQCFWGGGPCRANTHGPHSTTCPGPDLSVVAPATAFMHAHVPLSHAHTLAMLRWRHCMPTASLSAVQHLYSQRLPINSQVPLSVHVAAWLLQARVLMCCSLPVLRNNSFGCQVSQESRQELWKCMGSVWLGCDAPASAWCLHQMLAVHVVAVAGMPACCSCCSCLWACNTCWWLPLCV